MPRPTKAKHEKNPLPVKVHECTGMAMSDAKAERVAAAFLSGMSIRAICRAYGTSHQSVVALVKNRADLLEKARELTAKNWRTLAVAGTAELLDRLEDLNSHQLGILSAIAVDKDLLLSGQPTQRVEVSVAPAAEQWDAFVAGLRQREDAIDVAFEPVQEEAPPAKKEYAQLC
jgi:hypothetical protein